MEERIGQCVSPVDRHNNSQHSGVLDQDRHPSLVGGLNTDCSPEKESRSLLDVEIIVYLGAAALRPSLSGAISSVHRWRSIRAYLGGTGEQLQVLFDHLNSLYFPSLCHVCIDAYETYIDLLDHNVHYPDFLFPQWSPALERLEIYTERLGTLDDFPAYSTVTHLSVQYHRVPGPSSLSSSLAPQKSTYLELHQHDALPQTVFICHP
ncbi:hypothetical protein BKA82DRAFT_28670 [Pisolithus tinctorius]|uniref:Uncharacterized protein n=1 Tax=Pisolithus tinctorius Marx 270 TaxID=870435 RepID=A0A0C3IX32_PISTI|nr:hypothetical protein BKA82DRAFT_28670 [Pisolithus tinctorius]KIO01358.1 hypothetical protein M404DRAFT_28670 [Pisolithus tinctorius Marx 270]